ncbi:MAG: 4-phosphoerythronate dehydrogenase [Gammaproteobacteria bacterium]|nr:4-phosphoerythronate dehydrogenase [Gammaproteobacteria bacterium]
MIKVLADNSFPDLDDFFGSNFQMTRYASRDDLLTQIIDQDILLCRSTLAVTAALLETSKISCVATASSGIDHLDLSYLTAREITVCDAKGANAKAVADYVSACVASLQRQGHHFGLRAAVVGVGVVGALVVARLQALGFEVLMFDPLRALQDPQFISCEHKALFDCDLLCLHANLHDEGPYASRHFLDAAFFARLKPQTVIINAARGDIVDEAALLACEQRMIYCTDVYANEPHINPGVVAYATICTPHIAGHSIEARHRALQLLRHKIHILFGMHLNNDSVFSILGSGGAPVETTAILSLYDPDQETQALKQSRALSKTFTALRKAHCHRHDFDCERIDLTAVS